MIPTYFISSLPNIVDIRAREPVPFNFSIKKQTFYIAISVASPHSVQDRDSLTLILLWIHTLYLLDLVVNPSRSCAGERKR